MPIYEFTISQTILVKADSVLDARQVADSAIPDLFWQEYNAELEQEITSQKDLNQYKWDIDSIPYGGEALCYNTRTRRIEQQVPLNKHRGKRKVCATVELSGMEKIMYLSILAGMLFWWAI